MRKFLLMMMAMFIATGIYAQEEKPIKIITNHPDFKVKVKRCAASNKTVVIDLIFNNVSSSDVKMRAYGGTSSVAYDDEGNMYKDGNLQVSIANTNSFYQYGTDSFVIPADVPVKITIQLENVSASAEAIPRLMVALDCDKWGLNPHKPIIINNIPISRD